MKLRSFAPILGLCLLLSIGIPVLACINVYGTNIEGKSVTVSGRGGHSHLEGIDPVAVRADWLVKLKSLEAAYKPEAHYKIRNDYAAALIHTGEPKKAIEILLGIEKSNPDQYATATNLGTAYELSGDNENAIKWIKEGVQRNKGAHEGTEWIHVRILEVKQELAKNPQWLKTNSVLGLNFGSEKRPLMPVLPVTDYQGNEIKPEDVIKGAQYQLHERLQFVSAPDPVVADMLFDLGNYTAATSTVEGAATLYAMALKFDHPRKAAVQERLDFMNSISPVYQKFLPQDPTTRALAWIVVGICFLFALWGLMKLIGRRRSA